MKKLLLLLMALLGLGVSGAWAQSSPVTAFSDINVDRLYTISAAQNRGNWMYGPADPLFVSSTYKLGYAASSDDSKQQWAFWKIDDKYYLYNVGAERFATAQYGYNWSGSFLTLTPFPITPVDALEASTNTTYNTDYPTLVIFGGSALQTFGVSNGQTHAVYRYNDAGDPGNASRIADVADFTSAQKERATELTTGSLPIVSSSSTIYFYNIWNMRSDKIVSYSPDGTQLDQTDANNEYSAFYFRAVDDGYYIYSATNGLPLKDVSSGSVTFGTNKDDATKFYIYANGNQSIAYGVWATYTATGFCISTSSTLSDNAAWNDGSQSAVTKWQGNDGGSVWRFSTALNSANNLTKKRNEVKNYIDNYITIGASVEAKNTLEAVYNDVFSSIAELNAAEEAFLGSISDRVYRIKNMSSGYSKDAYIYNNSYDVKHPISYQSNTYATPYWSASTSEEVSDFSYFYLKTTDGARYNSSVVLPGTYKIVQVYNNEPLMADLDATITLIDGQTDQFNIKIGGNSLHAQQSGSALVYWNYSDNTANNASAWTFEPVAENSIDLELINARAKVRSIYKFFNNHTFGTELGQYHSGSRRAEDVNTDKSEILNALNNPDATREALNVQLSSYGTSLANNAELFEYLYSTFAPYVTETSINFPSNGQFIYMKSANNSRYVQAVTSGQLAMSTGSPTIDNIFTYTDGKLVSYLNGHYIKNTRDMAEVGASDNLSITFEEATVIGKYEIQGASSNYMYGYASGHEKEGKLDRITGANNKNTDPCRWILEKVTELPITFKGEYASFFSPVDLTIPKGVQVYTGTVNGEWLTLNEITTGTLPANTGVILKGTAGATVNFPILSTVTSDTSALKGTVAAKPAVTGGVLVLGKNEGTWGIYNYTGELGGFKAYMDMPSTPVKGFAFNFDDTDAISSISDGLNKGEVYDMQGRRVSQPTRGLYIVNGKKVLVK